MNERAARKRRLFVGIVLDEEARARCAAQAQEIARTGFTAKYEPQEKLHVTLAFLGFVAASQFDDGVAALRAAAAPFKPFDLSLDKVGAFPHERKPRVVYLGARDQGSRFRSLAAGVRDAYAALGFEFAGDPVAHVTIARVKESKRPLPMIDVKPIRLDIREIALFESFPDPARKTSHYEVLTAAPLAATSAG